MTRMADHELMNVWGGEERYTADMNYEVTKTMVGWWGATVGDANLIILMVWLHGESQLTGWGIVLRARTAENLGVM